MCGTQTKTIPVDFLELEPEFSIKVKNHTTSFHTLNYNHSHPSEGRLDDIHVGLHTQENSSHALQNLAKSL
jgi:hypothetical protein